MEPNRRLDCRSQKGHSPVIGCHSARHVKNASSAGGAVSCSPSVSSSRGPSSPGERPSSSMSSMALVSPKDSNFSSSCSRRQWEPLFGPHLLFLILLAVMTNSAYATDCSSLLSSPTKKELLTCTDEIVKLGSDMVDKPLDLSDFTQKELDDFIKVKDLKGIVTTTGQRKLDGGILLRRSASRNISLYIKIKKRVTQQIQLINNLEMTTVELKPFEVIPGTEVKFTISGNKRLSQKSLDDLKKESEAHPKAGSYVQDFGECDFDNKPLTNVAELEDCQYIRGDLVINEKTNIDTKPEIPSEIRGCFSIKNTKFTDLDMLERITTTSCAKNHEVTGNKELCIFPEQQKTIKEKFNNKLVLQNNKDCKGECSVDYFMKEEDTACKIIKGKLIIAKEIDLAKLKHLEAIEEIHGRIIISQTNLTDINIFPNLHTVISSNPQDAAILISGNKDMTSFSLPALKNVTVLDPILFGIFFENNNPKFTFTAKEAGFFENITKSQLPKEPETTTTKATTTAMKTTVLTSTTTKATTRTTTSGAAIGTGGGSQTGTGTGTNNEKGNKEDEEKGMKSSTIMAILVGTTGTIFLVLAVAVIIGVVFFMKWFKKKYNVQTTSERERELFNDETKGRKDKRIKRRRGFSFRSYERNLDSRARGMDKCDVSRKVIGVKKQVNEKEEEKLRKKREEAENDQKKYHDIPTAPEEKFMSIFHQEYFAHARHYQVTVPRRKYNNEVMHCAAKREKLVINRDVTTSVAEAKSVKEEEMQKKDSNVFAHNMRFILHELCPREENVCVFPYDCTFGTNKALFESHFNPLKFIQNVMSTSAVELPLQTMHSAIDWVLDHNFGIGDADEGKQSRQIIRVHGPAHIIGDTHGSLLDLQALLSVESDRSPSVTGSGSKIHPMLRYRYVFTGDYFDRGIYDLTNFLLLAVLAKFRKNKIFLLRGNHEVYHSDNPFYWKAHLHQMFGPEEVDMYELDRSKLGPDTLFCKLLKLRDKLPVAAVVAGKIFAVHGGINRSVIGHTKGGIDGLVRGMEIPFPYRPDCNSWFQHAVQYKRLGKFHFNDVLKRIHFTETMMDALTWSDPGLISCPRNTGRGFSGAIFSKEDTMEFLKNCNLDLIVRGHEDTGFAVEHDNRCITIFGCFDLIEAGCPGIPYVFFKHDEMHAYMKAMEENNSIGMLRVEADGTLTMHAMRHRLGENDSGGIMERPDELTLSWEPRNRMAESLEESKMRFRKTFPKEEVTQYFWRIGQKMAEDPDSLRVTKTLKREMAKENARFDPADRDTIGGGFGHIQQWDFGECVNQPHKDGKKEQKKQDENTSTEAKDSKVVVLNMDELEDDDKNKNKKKGGSQDKGQTEKTKQGSLEGKESEVEVDAVEPKKSEAKSLSNEKKDEEDPWKAEGTDETKTQKPKSNVEENGTESKQEEEKKPKKKADKKKGKK